MKHSGVSNIDLKTVQGFGEEWKAFNQTPLSDQDLLQAFNRYFHIFPWKKLPSNPVGFDMGCGSGRWAKFVAPKVHTLHCIDASSEALQVARQNLSNLKNCHFHEATFDNIPLKDESMDFGYSLGVLHHIPSPQQGLNACVTKLKKGTPFLLYVYYRFDNRPKWFAWFWKLSEVFRLGISKAPFWLRRLCCELIAATIYWPMARAAKIGAALGINVFNWPLSFYRNHPFYVLRTDALDRFGTRLEHRFTKQEIAVMMEKAGLIEIQFYEDMPFWCAVGIKE